jgi:hypothetical protein
MNKRIKELVQQTDAWCDQNHAGDKFYDVRWEEKFAESIIWEVVDQMEECFAGSKTSKEKEELWIESAKTFAAWNGAIKLSRNKIKERFGVEE